MKRLGSFIFGGLTVGMASILGFACGYAMSVVAYQMNGTANDEPEDEEVSETTT